MKRSTPEHPKLLDLCARMKLRRWEAVGILESLWHFTAKFAPQGDIGKHSNSAIARAIDWNRDPDRLIQGLLDSRWLDPCDCHRLMIHDWQDHADQTLKRLLASRNLAFIQHSASTKKRAQPTCLATASLPLPLPLPEPDSLPTLSHKQNFLEVGEVQRSWWDDFWSEFRRLYPKRGKLNPHLDAQLLLSEVDTEEESQKVLVGLRKWIACEDWKAGYIEKASTWISGRMWEMEPPPNKPGKAGRSAMEGV